MSKNFHAALLMSKSILEKNLELVSRGLLDTEAEQLLVAAYRYCTDHLLPRIQVYSQMHDLFPGPAWDRLAHLSQQRAQGKLLQHLTGFQVFLDHEYEVGPEVLVPRPETEILVETAFAELSLSKKSLSLGLEIGLGSGIISIELLSRFSGLKMIASELSPTARVRALSNFKRILGTNSIQKDRLVIIPVSSPLEVFHSFEQKMLISKGDFLISNPPYLISADSIDSEVLCHEPLQALFAPEAEPLYFYRVIADQAMNYLKTDGIVFVELPHERALLIGQLFENKGWEVIFNKDLTGRYRVLIAKLRV